MPGPALHTPTIHHRFPEMKAMQVTFRRNCIRKFLLPFDFASDDNKTVG